MEREQPHAAARARRRPNRARRDMDRAGAAAFNHAEPGHDIARVDTDSPACRCPPGRYPSPLRARRDPAALRASTNQLRGGELRQFLVADIEIAGNALDLFMVLELFHQLEHLLGGMA